MRRPGERLCLSSRLPAARLLLAGIAALVMGLLVTAEYPAAQTPPDSANQAPQFPSTENSLRSVDENTEAEPVPDLSVDEFVSGLSIPWGIAFTPDGTMLFTEKSGVLRARLADGTIQPVTADLDDLFASGETGLMAIVVDPDFATNRRFYTCQGHTGPEVQVIAWTVDAAYAAASRADDPLVGALPSYGRHGGCRLRFGPDGHLWIATGDAAIGTNPQELSSLGGKVLRVDATTGTGAPGNPFPSSPLIYSYGHRNLQGLALRPGTDQMWSVEHGPTRDDEINFLVSGGNYGWDPVPGYDESVPMTDRVKFPEAVEAKWSSGDQTLATSGGIFLEGDQWGRWEGRLAVASLKDRTLRVFEFAADGTLLSEVIVDSLNGTYGRLRTPMLGPDGALYVSTSNGGGRDKILRVAPTPPPPPPPPPPDASEVFEVFDDIASGAYYEPAVTWMIANEVTAGCSSSLFCPNDNVSRAQFATFLWRAAGEPAPQQGGSEVFVDVNAGSYADQAIGWAVQTGITLGCGRAAGDEHPRFCPTGTITRAQASTMLFRMVGSPSGIQPADFDDVAAGDYYGPAVAWMQQHAITAGCTARAFCPHRVSTRADAAAFIHRTATTPQSWAPGTSPFATGSP